MPKSLQNQNVFFLPIIPNNTNTSISSSFSNYSLSFESAVGIILPSSRYVLSFISGITIKLTTIFKHIPNIQIANTTVPNINSVYSKLKFRVPQCISKKIYISHTSQFLKKQLFISPMVASIKICSRRTYP